MTESSWETDPSAELAGWIFMGKGEGTVESAEPRKKCQAERLGGVGIKIATLHRSILCPVCVLSLDNISAGLR